MFITISQTLDHEEEWKKLIPHTSCNGKHKLDLIGTVDGLLCLQGKSSEHRRMFVISNPVTEQQTLIHQT